jgi:hypothetical protein
LTIDEIETVSGGEVEINFLGLATISGDKFGNGCMVWVISFQHGWEGGYKCPAP